MAKEIVQRPDRPPDHVSKRGVHYWWSPEWLRGTSSSNSSFGRIKAVKEHGTVNLYMLSKDGNLSYIQGSIQDEFKKWHVDRSLDYLLLGEDPQEIDDLIINESW
jgi:hypothetical protein